MKYKTKVILVLNFVCVLSVFKEGLDQIVNINRINHILVHFKHEKQ